MDVPAVSLVTKLVDACQRSAGFSANARVDQGLAFLLGHLSAVLPGIPIVAAEVDPSTYRGFESARAALFVARIDRAADGGAPPAGLSIMVGYAEGGRPVAGVVLSTGMDGQRRTYAGAVGEGAFLVADDGTRSPIRLSLVHDLAAARCAVARSHRSKVVDSKLAALGCKELAPFGGDALKPLRVASGELELFADPSFEPVELWDVCAPEAVLRAAGGVFTDAKGAPFYYKAPLAQGQGKLAGGPEVHAAALKRFAEYDQRTGGATVT